nr:hypothetical protein [Streptomyces yokosukanensis]
MTTTGSDCGGLCAGHGVGGDLAAGPDGVVVRAGHAGRQHRDGDVHEPGPGPGRGAQLLRRRLRGALPQVPGGRPKTFTLLEQREIKKIAKSKSAEHSLPFSTWSLVKLAFFLVDEGVVDDISHEGLRILLREEGVTFQRVKTWKTSKDRTTRPKGPGRTPLCHRRRRGDT